MIRNGPNESFLYEEFVPTDLTIAGTKKKVQKDLKIYTVGEHYAHAEARKSPEVDGLVERYPDGREVRHIVSLTEQEQMIASTIVRCFKQRVCGFDVLRRQKGDSFVCDVNGWSFVKGNEDYYNSCGEILSRMFVEKARKIREEFPSETAPLASNWKLRGSVSVFRHADRTPKQKVKLKVTHHKILALFNGTKEIKMKSDKNQDQLNVLASIILEILQQQVTDGRGHLSGIEGHDSVTRLQLIGAVLSHLYQGLKIQIKPMTINEAAEPPRVARAMMVCKWGGMLTKQGEYQAWRLGKSQRNQFVIGCENSYPLEYYMDPPPYISSNNERRVKRTAELVGAGLLGKKMEEPATVHDNEESNHILGDIDEAKEIIDEMKSKISDIIHAERMKDIKEFLLYSEVPPLEEMARSYQEQNPLGFLLNDLSNYLKCVCRRLEILQASGEKVQITDETLPLMIQRWKRLTEYIYNRKTHRFDTTKVPDVEDYIKYDIIHNRKVIGDRLLIPLYSRAKVLSDFIVPREYGITPENKLQIGYLTCQPLCQSILGNIRAIMEEASSPSIFLHFTSESHVHPLLNLLLHTKVVRMKKLDFFVELNYLTQVIFKVFEDTDKPANAPDRFLIQLFYSAGAIGDALASLPSDDKILPVVPALCINTGISLEQLEKIFAPQQPCE